MLVLFSRKGQKKREMDENKPVHLKSQCARGSIARAFNQEFGECDERRKRRMGGYGDKSSLYPPLTALKIPHFHPFPMCIAVLVAHRTCVHAPGQSRERLQSIAPTSFWPSFQQQSHLSFSNPKHKYFALLHLPLGTEFVHVCVCSKFRSKIPPLLKKKLEM